MGYGKAVSLKCYGGAVITLKQMRTYMEHVMADLGDIR